MLKEMVRNILKISKPQENFWRRNLWYRSMFSRYFFLGHETRLGERGWPHLYLSYLHVSQGKPVCLEWYHSSQKWLYSVIFLVLSMCLHNYLLAYLMIWSYSLFSFSDLPTFIETLHNAAAGLNQHQEKVLQAGWNTTITTLWQNEH